MPLLKMTLTSRQQFQKSRSETQRSTPNDTCPHCGRESVHTRMSFKEITINTLCLCLLLAFLIGVWPLASNWMEQQEHRLLDRTIWSEPIDHWI